MMPTNSQARDRAESRFAVQQKRSFTVKTDQQAEDEVVRQKTARLKSLRLAKEATEGKKKARPGKA